MPKDRPDKEPRADGYRLLTAEDVGKTFGIELEPNIKIETDVFPNTSYIDTFIESDGFNCHVQIYKDDFDQLYFKDFDKNETVMIKGIFGWIKENIAIVSEYCLESEVTYTKWLDKNNWIYVKDRTDPPQHANRLDKCRLITENLGHSQYGYKFKVDTSKLQEQVDLCRELGYGQNRSSVLIKFSNNQIFVEICQGRIVANTSVWDPNIGYYINDAHVIYDNGVICYEGIRWLENNTRQGNPIYNPNNICILVYNEGW